MKKTTFNQTTLDTWTVRRSTGPDIEKGDRRPERGKVRHPFAEDNGDGLKITAKKSPAVSHTSPKDLIQTSIPTWFNKASTRPAINSLGILSRLPVEIILHIFRLGLKKHPPFLYPLYVSSTLAHDLVIDAMNTEFGSSKSPDNDIFQKSMNEYGTLYPGTQKLIAETAEFFARPNVVKGITNREIILREWFQKVQSYALKNDFEKMCHYLEFMTNHADDSGQDKPPLSNAMLGCYAKEINRLFEAAEKSVQEDDTDKMDEHLSAALSHAKCTGIRMPKLSPKMVDFYSKKIAECLIMTAYLVQFDDMYNISAHLDTVADCAVKCGIDMPPLSPAVLNCFAKNIDANFNRAETFAVAYKFSDMHDLLQENSRFAERSGISLPRLTVKMIERYRSAMEKSLALAKGKAGRGKTVSMHRELKNAALYSSKCETPMPDVNPITQEGGSKAIIAKLEKAQEHAELSLANLMEKDFDTIYKLARENNAETPDDEIARIRSIAVRFR